MSPCSLETEDTEHYFCKTLMNNLNYINTAIAYLKPSDLLRPPPIISFIKDTQNILKNISFNLYTSFLKYYTVNK